MEESVDKEEVEKFNEERARQGKRPLIYPGDPGWEDENTLTPLPPLDSAAPGASQQPPVQSAPAAPPAMPSLEQTARAAIDAARTRKPD